MASGTDESGGVPIKREGGGGAVYNRTGQLLYARDCIFECNSSCGLLARLPELRRRPRRTAAVAGRQDGRTRLGRKVKGKISAGTFICDTRATCSSTQMEAAGLRWTTRHLFNLDGEEKGQVLEAEAAQGAPRMCRRTYRRRIQIWLRTSTHRIGRALCQPPREPNLFVQLVFIEYFRRVHRIALFAARDILLLEELTYDYGYVVGSVEGKTPRAPCGAPRAAATYSERDVCDYCGSIRGVLYCMISPIKALLRTHILKNLKTKLY